VWLPQYCLEQIGTAGVGGVEVRQLLLRLLQSMAQGVSSLRMPKRPTVQAHNSLPVDATGRSLVLRLTAISPDSPPARAYPPVSPAIVDGGKPTSSITTWCIRRPVKGRARYNVSGKNCTWTKVRFGTHARPLKRAKTQAPKTVYVLF
jgi:hypothetical protein